MVKPVPQLGEMAQRARPKQLVNYHAGRAPHAAALDVIKKAFSDDVTFAQDLDIH